MISHENCQFQSYPDFSQIGKYTGVLYPYNLEIFRKRLADAGMEGMDRDFSMASGRFAAECFKADLEYAFRTPGFGGFQMLDLMDYPGQGTALVGILDAFMESKGVVSPEEFRSFCAPVVLLAEFDGHCLSRSDTLRADLLVANYLEEDLRGELSWRLSVEDVRSPSGVGEGGSLSGLVGFLAAQGKVSRGGNLCIPVSELAAGLSDDAAFSMVLELESEGYSNRYRFWVYPSFAFDDSGVTDCSGLDFRSDSGSAEVAVVTAADETLKAMLDAGKRVILVPEHSSVTGNTVGGMFIPDFWNWSMFKTISENAGKEVSPGTLSIINDAAHPLFSSFPNQGHGDWQWWSITMNSRPLIMDELEGYLPLVQMIDNAERCHKLGIVSEFAVGNGFLLVCMTDLDAIADTPEGAAFKASLLHYAASGDFRPSYRLGWEDLVQLLYGERDALDIQGVENQTDYSRQTPSADSQ